MAAATLNCPECRATTRPINPIPAGKRVRCPKCKAVFTVPEEEDDIADVLPADQAAAPRGMTTTITTTAPRAGRARGRDARVPAPQLCGS